MKTIQSKTIQFETIQFETIRFETRAYGLRQLKGVEERSTHTQTKLIANN